MAVSDEKLYISRKGLEKLQEAYKQLEDKRAQNKVEVGKLADNDADLPENPGFMQLKMDEAYVFPKRLAVIRDQIRRASTIEGSAQYRRLKAGTVGPGCLVRLVDEAKRARFAFTILGPTEADLDNDIISSDSPMAKALIGKAEGDVVSFRGNTFKIVKVKKVLT